jgi:hypothetical protein
LYRLAVVVNYELLSLSQLLAKTLYFQAVQMDEIQMAALGPFTILASNLLPISAALAVISSPKLII